MYLYFYIYIFFWEKNVGKIWSKIFQRVESAQKYFNINSS